MKFRATSALAALVLPSLLAMFLVPAAAAGLGDTLAVGSATIVPGNPCNANGPAGGIAVQEAGTSSVLYYTITNKSTIYRTSAYMPTSSPPPCLGTIVPASLPATPGWGAIAYDAFHPAIRLWALRADGSNTIYGMDLAGVVRATFTPVGVVTGFTVDEAAPHHLFVANGTSGVQKFAVALTGGPTYAVSAAGAVAFPQTVTNLAAWSGALLATDPSDWVRNHKTDGSALGLLFHPGQSFIDPWFQVQRTYHYFLEVAFDTSTYAASGKSALWTIDTNSWTTCIQNCPVSTCVLWEGTTCIQWQCTTNCDPAQWVFVTNHAPYVRAYEVFRTCPDGSTPAPTQPCPCATPPPPTFTAPQNAVIVRGAPTSPDSMPIIVQGSASVVASAPSSSYLVELKGPLPSLTTVVGYGNATSAPLYPALLPRGLYTFEAALVDPATSCKGPSRQFSVWLEDPTSWSRAQALRVEGNVPLNLVAGSVRVEPQDDLVGTEAASVLDRRHARPGLDLDLRALHANATNAVWGRSVAASARTVVIDGIVVADLSTLCFDLTSSALCGTLPTLHLQEWDLDSFAYAQAQLVSGGTYSWSSTEGHAGGGYLSAGHVREASYVSPCADFASVFVQVASEHVAPASPTGVPCTFAAGPFRVTLADTWQRSGHLFDEAYAAALRIEILEGPYRGEIVVSESYAGVSLGGRGLLQGPTAFAEAADDFASGADAPAAGGPVRPEGAWSGQFLDADRADSIRVAASVGEKVRVLVTPAHRLGTHAMPIPTAPNPNAAARQMRVMLVDPLGVVRDHGNLGTYNLHPALVELNVDVTGEWEVRIERTDTLDEAAPYLVEIALSDVALLAGDANAGDAPASCAGAPMLAQPAIAGSMGATDAADTFRLTVASGDAVTAILKPGDDLEGVDLDLRVLDASCNVVAQSLLGKGYVAKGETESLVQIVVPAGAAFVQVVRVNGIGNYALEAHAARRVP